VTIEWWTQGISHASVVAGQASRAEAAGWDGFAVVDSQNLAGDAYVGLALAAVATTSIKLGTGVTNSVTRHPAVTASAIASVHRASLGRAVLGLGRGDSSLAHLGMGPDRVDAFETYVELVQRYLRGDEIPFDDLPDDGRPITDLPIAEVPSGSKLHWLAGSKVPVDVTATGPKVIAAGARHGDRVMLAVGADPDRLAWGIRTAHAENPAVAVGAYLNIGCHTDIAAARDLVRGGLSTFARFSVMHGTVTGPTDEVESEVLSGIGRRYDMNKHTQVGSAQARSLTDDFVDRFAIAGTPDVVIERLQGVQDLGIDKVVVVGATQGSDPDVAKTSMTLITSEILSAFR
jgi:5,10-methylenetetrahydromethanopterin reductase